MIDFHSPSMIGKATVAVCTVLKVLHTIIPTKTTVGEVNARLLPNVALEEIVSNCILP